MDNSEWFVFGRPAVTPTLADPPPPQECALARYLYSDDLREAAEDFLKRLFTGSDFTDYPYDAVQAAMTILNGLTCQQPTDGQLKAAGYLDEVTH